MSVIVCPSRALRVFLVSRVACSDSSVRVVAVSSIGWNNGCFTSIIMAIVCCIVYSVLYVWAMCPVWGNALSIWVWAPMKMGVLIGESMSRISIVTSASLRIAFIVKGYHHVLLGG